MARKKRLEGTLLVEIKVTQTDGGPALETLESFKDWLTGELDGIEANFQDPDLEEDSSAVLSVESIKER